jgi:AcrR family transcriptional regulator
MSIVAAALVERAGGSDGGGVARPRKPDSDPRRRRTAEEARAAILDAAERRLVVSGPAGIRLQEVAADVGLSHPAVLHHFGSREALVKEVCERRFAAIHQDVVGAIAASAGGAEEIGGMLDSVFQALEAHGHGRVVFWLALEGLLAKKDELRLHDVGTAAHALRTRKRKGKTPPLDDTLHVIALASLALLAESVLGRAILRDAGLGDDRAARARFRSWLAKLLADYLESGPRPSPP